MARLPEAVQPTADSVLSARATAEAAGRLVRTPPQFGWRAVLCFRRARLFRHIRPRLRRPAQGDRHTACARPKRWVALQRASGALFICHAGGRAAGAAAAWTAGASSRLVGRAIVTNAPMLITLAALAIAAARRVRGASRAWTVGERPGAGLRGGAGLARNHCAAHGGDRLSRRRADIDTAAALLPAVPALLAVVLFEGRSAVERDPCAPPSGASLAGPILAGLRIAL